MEDGFLLQLPAYRLDAASPDPNLCHMPPLLCRFRHRKANGESGGTNVESPRKPGAAPGALDLVNSSRTPAVTNRVPKSAPIGPASSSAPEFKPLLAPHSPTAFGADPVQDVGNHLYRRLKASQCDGWHRSSFRPRINDQLFCICHSISARRTRVEKRTDAGWRK